MDLTFLEGLKSSIKYIALASAIVGTIGYPKYAVGKGKYFLFALWFIAITEFSYRFVYYKILDGKHSIYFISNIHYLIIGSFYLLWYRSLIPSKRKRKIIVLFLICYLLFFVLNTLLWEPFLTVQTYTFVVAALFVITSIFFYFNEILQTEKILKFERSVYFWFTVGILIFWVPYIPLKLTSTYFEFKGALYSLSIFTLNFLMHLFFIIGVIWSQKKYNY